jgi:hypothetical protein
MIESVPAFEAAAKCVSTVQLELDFVCAPTRTPAPHCNQKQKKRLAVRKNVFPVGILSQIGECRYMFCMDHACVHQLPNAH